MGIMNKTVRCRIRAAFFLAQGATKAILCASDDIARGVLAELRRLGLRVPGDVSVMGYDDLPLAAGCRPPLPPSGRTGWRWAKCVQPAGQSDERCCRKAGAAASAADRPGEHRACACTEVGPRKNKKALRSHSGC